MILTDQNFLIYSARHYINYNCDDTKEFLEDVSRIKYIKKLFTVYKNKEDLNINLIMNHLIILYNIFETHACTKMLFLKLPEHWVYLKTILHFTGRLPDVITGIHSEDCIIETGAIPFDGIMYTKVKELLKL